MRVTVDSEKCQGHQACSIAAPELFESDDFGYAFAVGDGVVPAGQEEKARRAVANCPEHAVIIIED